MVGTTRGLYTTVLGGWLAALASAGLVACAATMTPPPTGPAPVRAEAFWASAIAEGAGRVTPGAYTGPLFALRMDGPWLTTSAWVKCPLQVRYRYEALDPQVREVAFATVDALARFLPHGYQFFEDELQRGATVRIRYVVAGRFVVQGDPSKLGGVVCNAATHYARTIVVGAYRVEVDHGVSTAGLSTTVQRVEVQGTPERCGQPAGQDTTLAGCRVPLAYDLRGLALARGLATLRVSDAAGPEGVPSEATMPRPVVDRP